MTTSKFGSIVLLICERQPVGIQKSKKHDPSIAQILAFCLLNFWANKREVKRQPWSSCAAPTRLFFACAVQRNEKKVNLERFKDRSFCISPQTSENILVHARICSVAMAASMLQCQILWRPWNSWTKECWPEPDMPLLVCDNDIQCMK
jgi:hypothetical protein